MAVGEPPVGPNHAFLIGQVWAALQRLTAVDEATTVDLLTDEHGGTDTILITRRSGTYRVTIKPEETIQA